MGIKTNARISQASQTTLIISKTLSKVSDGGRDICDATKVH